jgi:hypothetical protein
MVSGKPYISANKAMINAENPPNVRQSRAVFGLKKLKPKTMKMRELIATSPHNP